MEDRMIDQCFALGNKERIRILNQLRERPQSVTELLKDANLTQSTLSHHLRILRKAGLVNGIRDGRHVYYAIRKNGLQELRQNIQEYDDSFPLSSMMHRIN